jgi:multidrug efflux pump subunit AcrB
MKDILLAFIRNNVFANVLLSIVIGTGMLSAFMMVREFFPEFSVDTITVEVLYPGQDPVEVEEGINRKIEEAIDGLEGIKRYTTVALENQGRAIIEVSEGYDVDEVYDRIRNAVDSIPSFPADAEKPIITKLTFKNVVLYLALSGDLDERTLKEWAERSKDELQRLDGVTQVNVFGAREYEIAIEVSEQGLREYNLSFSHVTDAVRRGSMNLSAGVLRTTGEEIRLRTVGRKYTGAEMAEIVVLARADGTSIKLGDIATIRDEFTDDRIIAEFNGKPSVLIGVFKTPDEDAIAIAETVREWAEQRNDTLPEGASVSIWSDRSYLIRDRINLLLGNGFVGLILVFCLLWLFLDLRLSFWVAMGIPTSLSGALALLWGIGGTINMISLFGLIMVLGIIVDDAIVIGEAIYVHRKKGDPPMRAALNGVAEVGMPVIAAVTTTIVAFIPLLFVGGVMGKFIAVLPVVVIAALSVSLTEALIILPAHLNHLPDLNAAVGPGHPIKRRARAVRRHISHGMEWFTGHVYEPFVAWALQWRYVAACVAIASVLIMVGILKGGFVKYVMFPEMDGNDIVATIEFPHGTPISVTNAAVAQTRQALERLAASSETISGEPMIRNIYSVAGQAGDGFLVREGPNLGEVRVELLETEQRGINSNDINRAWEREAGRIPGALSQTFAGMEEGPPGSAIEVWLQGEHMEDLLGGAAMLKERLRRYEGVYQVADDFRPGKNELQLDLKPEARALGLTLADLAQQVYAGFYGEEAMRIQRGRDDIRVKVRYTEDERSTLARLDSVRIRTPRGDEVPFHSVANVLYGQGFSSITRVDGLRLVKVTAEVDHKTANADEIMADLVGTGFMAGLQQKFPALMWSHEGPNKDNRDAMSTLVIGFPAALFGIFVIIATIFRSYAQTLIIMVTVPFGIIGAVLGHLIMGYDITMLSMFGMVALAGVVVNDAIVLIESINSRLSEGMPVFEAIRKGGARRFRAIFLTSASTIGGLAPLILERNLQAQFLIPMALSIAAGVGFATLLTLVLEPCLLAILNDLRRVFHLLVHRQWPTREEVEPATRRNVDVLQSLPLEVEVPATTI